MSIQTPGAIVDVLIDLTAAATPDLSTADAFRPHREDATGADIRAFAESKPLACLRLFSIRARLESTIPDVCDGNQERVRDTIDVVIAYPNTNRYVNLLGLDKIIAADLRKIRGTIGYAGFPLTYAQHGSLCTVLGDSADVVERGPVVTFATLALTVEYWRTLL